MVRLLLLVLVLLLPVPSWAAGPTVGTNCTASWSPVTQNTDGTPVTGTITYNWYVSTTGVAPGTPTLTGIAVTSVQPCATLTPGQYTGWVSAVETLAGSASESALSVAFPFVLIRPGTPTLNVR